LVLRKPIIAGNWKMHKTVGEAVRLAKQLKVLVADDVRTVEIVVCPPFTALQSVGEVLKGTGIQLGAQNVHWEDEGAYTGEVSPAMLKDLSCQYVILGHSERRQMFGESDGDVRKKLDAVLAKGMSAIACVGETIEERRAGKTEDVIVREVKAIADGLTLENPSRLVIAYEPIWAIGTGETATSDEANRVAKLVRQTLAGAIGQELAQDVRIQYGGSVKPDNIGAFMRESDIDGALVGGASLDASSFAEIVRF